MVSASRIEGGPQKISAGVLKTIQYIKEIVKDHSDAEIYFALKETNMDPNETAQKLLNQDPFREVRRKRDKRKEVPVLKDSIASQPRKHPEHVTQGMRLNTYSDRNSRRGRVYSRNAVADAKVSGQFHAVKDNRTNQNTNSHIKPPSAHGPISTNEPVAPKDSDKSSTGASNNQKTPVGQDSSQPSKGTNDLQPDSATSSNNSLVGVYSSSSDPVHVPSPDSRPAANVGAIKREVGVVGVRHQPTENSKKLSNSQSSSTSNSQLRHDGPSREPVQSSTSKSDQPSQTPVPESAMLIMVSKPFKNNMYSRRRPKSMVHQKVSKHKEWKPKVSQKQRYNGPGVIGTSAKVVSPPDDAKEGLETEAAADQLQDKLSLVNISEDQNVFTAPHIRVPEADRSRLTFGSLGPGWNPVSQSTEAAAEESCTEPSISAPETSSEEACGSKQVDLVDERLRNSETNSSASGAVSEHQLADRQESSTSQDLDNYAAGIILESQQQQQDPPQLPSFSQSYDPRTMYDPSYFRPTVDETARGHGLQSPQETLIRSHAANSIPVSTMAMVQQPLPPMAQMYPQQVPASPYTANLVPLRQFISPFYVPPMAMPGYSNNPAYPPPHPSNGGNSYVMMPPGGSSQLTTANGLKYGIRQFKSTVPSASPTGFGGNFTNPNGYAGLDDPSRLKYNDGNMYVSNLQGEMNQRGDVAPNFQSASYYNMTAGQAAYLPSHTHTGHASFNTAVGQSSHMQFQGMYHPSPPPQPPAGIPSPHHLGPPPAMGGNIGVGLGTVGGQVGSYQQQPQLGHMNWTGNF